MDTQQFCQEYERTRDERVVGREISDWGTYKFLIKKKKKTKGYSPLWIKYLKKNGLLKPPYYQLKQDK